ncbi:MULTISPECIES: hypothetical protein [Chryseobacterium]|uniref:DUF3329 domain-containing protein n=1 Tax=Chryseobacterium camelliae TaxID=1265445 RepID=A0ABU0TI48_9FLAO|nr:MULTISPECIES: hypothetical protein [Chryseobacterium]MDT3409418.1 hypothetical protein [Pseudacidovorax intermedius]MDQ1096717.1 hypothetical protein [Chryseobacterium camelliae]MDQ1100661.1 hypothetical protein [Chryseobacterium sp. SORGH_AS_1048]MDR6087999.1 hypothetical protein [Chryseobacterium sp. SORGH_AS_0909]MDR6132374.1 hypothetical protein [Chryseobacterium sp. SORGH_AS_1175]
MNRKLKRMLIISFVILALIHLAYFIYGYFTFSSSIKEINIYTEFYRFKFYDDVSISHIFITGLFLSVFLIVLLRNHSGYRYTGPEILRIGAVLLLVSLLSSTFFISYSVGANAKIRTELPEKAFNDDKTMLNVLRPFLYNYTSYSSEKLFNPENILYPKPYPVIEERDTTYYDPHNKEYYSIEHAYYSIDTLKMANDDLKSLREKTRLLLSVTDIDENEFKKRIISKKAIGDSTEVVYKGVEVNPKYDDNICIFLENNQLFIPVHNIPERSQQYRNAVTRYQLLYKYPQDSMLNSFRRLSAMLNTYGIENKIVPKELTRDVFFYRDHRQEPLNGIRNYIDRNALKEKFKAFDRLFYHPNYLHPSIMPIFIAVVLGIWAGLFGLFLLVNLVRKKRVPGNSNA